MRTILIVMLSTLAVSAAHAQSDCDSVRRTRELAVRSGLDGDNLARLEVRACGREGPRHPAQHGHEPHVGPDCRALRVMSALAHIAEASAEDLSMIESARVVACRGVPERSMSRWPNRRMARSSADTWYYPNGTLATTGTNWYYPNRVLAVSGDTLYYPNRVLARTGNGSWYNANRQFLGGDGEAGTWACDRLGSDSCNEALRLVPFLGELARRVQFVELLWAAS